MKKESKVKTYLMLFLVVEMVSLVFLVIDIIVRESMQAKADTKADTGYALVSDDDVCIFTDSETGVQYVVYREREGNAGMGGITPRLDADGNIMIDSSLAE